MLLPSSDLRAKIVKESRFDTLYALNDAESHVFKVTVNKIGYLPGKSSCARYFKRNPGNLYITEKLIKCRF